MGAELYHALSMSYSHGADAWNDGINRGYRHSVNTA